MPIDTSVGGPLIWLVRHWDHNAWYQRALVSGDFRPGLAPISEYVTYLDGTTPDPEAAPVCCGCGQVPRVEDLTPVERTSGRADFLQAFRQGLIPWREATNRQTCQHCNSPTAPLTVTGYVRLCGQCEEHLAAGGM